MKNSKIKFAVIFLCLVLLSSISFYGGYEFKRIDADKVIKNLKIELSSLERKNEHLEDYNNMLQDEKHKYDHPIEKKNMNV